MAKLYEIADKYNELMNIIDFMYLDEMNLQSGAWDKMEEELNKVQDEFKSKVENIARLIENIGADIFICEGEELRLKNRRFRLEKAKEHLKNYLQHEMLKMNMKKVKTSLFDISIKANPPKVNIFNAKLIPKKYFATPEPVVLKLAIKEDLTNGIVVPGAELTRGESLRIK